MPERVQLEVGKTYIRNNKELVFVFSCFTNTLTDKTFYYGVTPYESSFSIYSEDGILVSSHNEDHNIIAIS